MLERKKRERKIASIKKKKARLAFLVLRAFSKQKFFTYRDIGSLLNVSVRQAQEYVRLLETAGYVSRVSGRKPLKFRILKIPKNVNEVFREVKKAERELSKT